MWNNIQFEKKTHATKHTQFSAHIILVAIGYMLSTGGGDVQVLCV